MNNLPLLSYIVVTYNRKQELIRCLDNLFKQLWQNKEIIVIDNGSTDGSSEVVRLQYPEARLVKLQKNLGAAGGRNQGIREAQGDYCVFLDDDAELADPQAGNTIVDLFSRDPELGLVAFTIRNATTSIEEYAAIPRADKRRFFEDYVCAYFCGCGFAARRTTLQDAGLFWDFLFYSGEELDLSYRLADAGHRLIHTRAIEVLHHNSPAGRSPGQYFYFNARNRVLIALRYLPWLFVISTALLWWVRLGYLSFYAGKLPFWGAGIRDAIRAVASVLRERQCLSLDTVRFLRLHSGRRWY
jgi:GT2 family glycosyltransferase